MPPPPEEPHLRTGPSWLPGAGDGLFTTADFPAGTDVCVYPVCEARCFPVKSTACIDCAFTVFPSFLRTILPLYVCSLLAEAALHHGSPRRYLGHEHSLQSATRLADRSYLLSLGERTTPRGTEAVYLDAKDYPAKARFINDPRSSPAYNVEFVREPQELRARVVALRALRAGEEVFADYGENYWDGAGFTPQSLAEEERQRRLAMLDSD